MDTAPLLTQLHAEVEQFGQLVTAALPGSAGNPVPACEGMVLAELVRHLGSVHHLVTDWVPEGRRPTAWVQALIGTNDDRGVYWVEWHKQDAGHWDLTWHSVSAESWFRMPTD